MNKTVDRVILLFVSLLFFVLCAVFMYLGYYKANVYVGTDFSLTVNAYVGGDAYNYIINANYATGYYVLGSACLICGVLCCIARTILAALPGGAEGTKGTF